MCGRNSVICQKSSGPNKLGRVSAGRSTLLPARRVRSGRGRGGAEIDAVDGGHLIPMSTAPRRFPPPWSTEESDACFIVRDRGGQAVADQWQPPGLTATCAKSSKRSDIRLHSAILKTTNDCAAAGYRLHGASGRLRSDRINRRGKLAGRPYRPPVLSPY
jgi:hypothetical protein